MINIAFSCITAFIITFLAIPSIIKVAVIKNLFDEPGGRKAHKSSIPTLGGLAIFAGVVFAFTFWSAGFNLQDTQYIIAAMTIIFFIGIKDDIVELPAIKKLYGQLIAAIIIVLFANIRITGLYGIFGIDQVPYWFSILFSIFTIILIINAFNLIDGVDGLAAGIGAIAAFTYGIYFYNYNEIALCILSFTLFSSLLAFLVYNFAPANIFMGDTGSLLIGLILSILTIKFIEMSFAPHPADFPFQTSPAMAIAILVIPLFDLLRVFFVRILNKCSPFSADRLHMHHLLLDMGLNHREVAITLYLVNIGFILIALGLHRLGALNLLFIIATLALLLSLIPFFLKYQAEKNNVSVKQES